MFFRIILLVSYLLFVWCRNTTLPLASTANLMSNQTSNSNTSSKSKSKRIDSNAVKVVSNRPEDVKVVACVILKDEDPYVDEWIHYNKYLGFNQIQIYDNSDTGSAKIAYLPQKYGDFVRVIHMPGKSKQKVAYADCGKRYVKQKYWAAFFDIDEFIVLRVHGSIQTLIHSLMPHGGALSIFRVFFGSNHHTRYEDKPVLSRFTRRRNDTDVYVKTIAYLPDTVSYEAHSVIVRNGTHVVDCHGNTMRPGRVPKAREAHEDVAAVYHFKIKSLEEYRTKRLRGDADVPKRGDKYKGPDGESVIKHEFLRYDKGSYAIKDTAALDFFERRKKDVKDFPSLHT